MTPAQVAVITMSCIACGVGLFIAVGAVIIENSIKLARFGAILAGAAFLPLLVMAVIH